MLVYVITNYRLKYKPNPAIEIYNFETNIFITFLLVFYVKAIKLPTKYVLICLLNMLMKVIISKKFTRPISINILH